MSKYNLEEGNDSLKRILLMMKYDESKTLSENKKILSEDINYQEIAKIATEINDSLDGDVKTDDLENIIKIFNERIVGKTFDGYCLLDKVKEYFKNVRKSKDILVGVEVLILEKGLRRRVREVNQNLRTLKMSY